LKKEAKTFYSIRLGHPVDRIGAAKTNSQSFFASFCSQKEDSSFQLTT